MDRRSDEDGSFVTEVPELEGCRTHGSTPQEALENCQQAIQLWIDIAKEIGKPIPAPKGRR
ncbi:MAG: type II toxin-antitoxin system HicB family antitoxin [Planctomycetes bacterium]|nr:type II toxin-antitoxin system HicB family antitoxin [Planctomycetota bacterium]